MDQSKLSVQEFYARYFGISHRGYNGEKSEYLIDFYPPRPEKTNNTFNLAYYNKNYNASFYTKYRLKWKSGKKMGRFDCLPGYRFDQVKVDCL